MERRPTRIRTTLALSMLALTLIAPWALGQDLTETRRLAEQGDVTAQYNLGVHYSNGDGVQQDDAEAARWYRLAAEQGNTDAQFNLGFRYSLGLGVPEDDAEAVRWYRLAADQGDADAQYSLGFMYATGDGVPENDAEAVKWYRLAAEQGNDRAQIAMGIIYAGGEGVLQDDAEAATMVPPSGRAGRRSCPVQPWTHLPRRSRRPQGPRARAHVVQHRWRKRERNRQRVTGQS